MKGRNPNPGRMNEYPCEQETKSKSEDDITDVDFASLRSLGAEGIDMSWIDGLQVWIDIESRIFY